MATVVRTFELGESAVAALRACGFTCCGTASPPNNYCGCTGTLPDEMYITRISDSFVVANLTWDGSSWSASGNSEFSAYTFSVYCDGSSDWELDDSTGTYSNVGPKGCTGNSMGEFTSTVAGNVYFGDTPSGS